MPAVQIEIDHAVLVFRISRNKSALFELQRLLQTGRDSFTRWSRASYADHPAGLSPMAGIPSPIQLTTRPFAAKLLNLVNRCGRRWRRPLRRAITCSTCNRVSGRSRCPLWVPLGNTVMRSCYRGRRDRPHTNNLSARVVVAERIMRRNLFVAKDLVIPAGALGIDTMCPVWSQFLSAMPPVSQPNG